MKLNKKLFFTILLLIFQNTYSHNLCKQLFVNENNSVPDDSSKALDPKEYFFSKLSSKNEPRLVVLIGPPGSGKSTFASFASIDWEVLESDKLRKSILEEMKQTSYTLQTQDGKYEPADPTKEGHHFAQEVLDQGNQKLHKMFDEALFARKSIVLDANNWSPLRSHFTLTARKIGYRIEAVVFDSPNPSYNIANLNKRKMTGALSPNDSSVLKRFKQHNFFNSNMKLKSDSKNLDEPIPDVAIERLVQIVEKYQTLEEAIGDLSYDERSIILKLISLDYFDQILRVPVSNFSEIPHDSPLIRNRFRVYAAITNKCNRACPWCSVYSTPQKNTYMTIENMVKNFPKNEDFDLQIEGGEPTIHPKFFDFVSEFRNHPRGKELILLTNGVKLPRNYEKLKSYLERLGSPLKIKMSINHYLLDNDPHLIELAKKIRSALLELGGDRELILNVRLRKGKKYDNDESVRKLVIDNGLLDISNVFFLQKYGLASSEIDWSEPYTINGNFVLINPDGSNQGTDLVGRSKKMGELE